MQSQYENQYLIILAYGKLSILELAAMADSLSLDLEIVWNSDSVAIVRCDTETSNLVIRRAGGSYKMAKILGNSLDNLDEIYLPDEPKFNWTVSGYGCPPEILEETRLATQRLLKSKSLGKSRYMKPDIEEREVSELKLMELYERVLSPADKTPQGMDVVVARGPKGEILYAYTVGASDVLGFEKRDFARSYQDPTVTIGPRLARVLVNLAMKQPGGTLLDPFCGLGTILQEGLIEGYNVVGSDISNTKVTKSITNVKWVKDNYEQTRRLKTKIIRAKATNLPRRNLPKVDGVATEPLLMEKFERNPDSRKAEESVKEVALTYEDALREFADILDDGSRVAVTVPCIFDSRGREHRLDLTQVFKDLGYVQYVPAGSGLGQYPLRVPTSKRKIIQRDIYVMTVKKPKAFVS